MPHLRIAAVQLNFQPVTRTSRGEWRLDEPLSPTDPLQQPNSPEFLLSYLKNQHVLCHDICEKAMDSSRQSYTSNFRDKIREIMTFCFRNEVNLVVFPEYAIPVDALSILKDFTKDMTIIAGIGYLQDSDISLLNEQGFDTQKVARANNAAAILSPKVKALITKKNSASDERMSPGFGPEVVRLEFTQGTINIGVALCIDYIREQTFINQEDPSLVVIPALSRNSDEFTEHTPRDYLRVFANHSLFGGTYIGAPDIQGGDFVDINGTKPLKKDVEGIVIVDWDYNNPYRVRPSKTRSPNHRLYARASLIYKGRDEVIAQRASQLSEFIANRDYDQIEDLQAIVKQALKRYHLLNDALAIAGDSSKVLEEYEIDCLCRHCIFSNSILTLTEWRYKQCVVVTNYLDKVYSRIAHIVSAAYGEYDKVARSLAEDVRSNFVQQHHQETFGQDKESSDRDQIVFYGALGPFDVDQAISTFPRQLTLLRTLADLQNFNLNLRYRLQTWCDTTGIMRARFTIICTTRDQSLEELSTLRKGFGQLIGVTFASGYSLSYSLDKVNLEETRNDIRFTARWWAEIKHLRSRDGSFIPFQGLSDFSLVADILRCLSVPSSLEIQCSAAPLATSNEETVLNNQLPTYNNMFIRMNGEKSSVLDKLLMVERFFSTMFEREISDERRLSVRIFVGSEEPLPNAVIEAIGVEIAGFHRYEIVTMDDSIDITEHDNISLNPIETLQIFHPPFGILYRSSGERAASLNLMINEVKFPQTGILLGTSKFRTVQADREIEIKIDDKDRLRHMYIVGKTGSGKTNFLKKLASQDVKIPGRGVTIIDPHGDLIDHVLREIPEDRLNEVMLINCARTDYLPVLNPLAIDREDSEIRDRIIQEMIWLLHSRIYHEWTGPRFDELARLAFLTMLDPGYPEAASFVEVPRLLMDEVFQKAAIDCLTNEDIKKRWAFQDKMRYSNQYGDVINWVTSKFDDIARDTTLKCVMGGGQSSINIEQIVSEGGILLVRIPEAVIGRQATDFIGSLILSQLHMAIMRRREVGEVQKPHFVYVDEFQNFATTEFHTLVAEARKFNIGFILANQNLEQLREFSNFSGTHEQRLINAIFGNVANLIVFGIGAFDANFLSKQLGVPENDLMRIGRFEAVAKILVGGFETTPFTLRGDEVITLESPLSMDIIEQRMKNSIWIERIKILEEVENRISRIIDIKTRKDVERQKEEAEKLRKTMEELEERRKKNRAENARIENPNDEGKEESEESGESSAESSKETQVGIEGRSLKDLEKGKRSK